MLNIMSRANENGTLVMDTCWRNIEDADNLVSENTCGCGSTRLLNNHCHWKAFIENTKLTISLSSSIEHHQ